MWYHWYFAPFGCFLLLSDTKDYRFSSCEYPISCLFFLGPFSQSRCTLYSQGLFMRPGLEDNCKNLWKRKNPLRFIFYFFSSLLSSMASTFIGALSQISIPTLLTEWEPKTNFTYYTLLPGARPGCRTKAAEKNGIGQKASRAFWQR